MRHLLLLSAVILPALTACTPSHCEVDGVQHRVGETYTCGDGCNICSCTLLGASTTTASCIEDTGDGDDTADTTTEARGTLLRGRMSSELANLAAQTVTP